MSAGAAPYGWRANVVDEPGSLSPRVHLWRPVGDEVEYVVGWGAAGHPVIRRVDAGASAPSEHPGFAFPPDALAALVEAVDASPRRGEIERLEQALAVERRRVDSLLEAVADVARRGGLPEAAVPEVTTSARGMAPDGRGGFRR